jgi:hypothetical protein
MQQLLHRREKASVVMVLFEVGAGGEREHDDAFIA